MRQLNEHGDRVGLSYRGALAGSLLSHLGDLDVLELMADDLFGASRRVLRAMRTLSDQIPVVVHGVSLGLCSAAPVCNRRLEAIARVVDAVQPCAWSEHLAFVRVGDLELGHLAAPPRTRSTVEGAQRNVERARCIVGSVPRLENVATLVVPPGPLSETGFTHAVLQACDAPLLLDLHNVYANAINQHQDPMRSMEGFPLHRVCEVHIAGGRELISSPAQSWWLDDHLHATPALVFDMLERLAALCPQSLAVILERDGHFPDFRELLAEVALARAALARGRATRRSA